MPNYQLSKIYKIVPVNGNEDEVYYGSTTEPYLSRRMQTHTSFFKSKQRFTTAQILFEKYGVQNCQILLVESFPCNSKDELRAKEAFYIKNNKCINQLVPYRTQEEVIEQRKQRDIHNKEAINEHRRLYTANNKDKIKTKLKEWREINKERIKCYSQERYIMNKDVINERVRNRNKENGQCECGINITIGSIARHKRSKKHQELMTQKNDKV